MLGMMPGLPLFDKPELAHAAGGFYPMAAARLPGYFGGMKAEGSLPTERPTLPVD
jgi:hypothetical protein